MAKTPTLYVCKNPSCVLGTPEQLGRFTGGISEVQKALLTGAPLQEVLDGGEYGDGWCPNCGLQGEEYDPAKAAKTALAEAKAQYEAQVAAIKEWVA